MWATNAYAADQALEHLSVYQLLTLQFAVAAAVLFAGNAITRRRTGDAAAVAAMGAQPLLVGVIGLTGTIFLQYLAFATAPIVAANVIAYGWPLMAALLLALTHPSAQARRGVPLALLGFCGVVLIFASDGVRLDGAGLGTWPRSARQGAWPSTPSRAGG
nr:hypothetical protein GCM10010200_100940 [Actinomadura rugatobispora]